MNRENAATITSTGCIASWPNPTATLGARNHRSHWITRPGGCSSRSTGSPGRYSGRIARTRSQNPELGPAHPPRSAIPVAGICGYPDNNARILETWGLDWKSLHSENSKLIVLQISGYGANTTLRDRPGLGKVSEAMSGVVEITGWPDGPPVHTGFSHADSVTGLMGAFAVMAAAYRRRTDPDFDGEWIDRALFEPIYRLIEWQVITHDQLNIVPRRAGNQMAVTPAAVVNTYLSADDHWITVTSASVKAVCKIVAMLGEPVEEYDTADKQRDRSGQLDEMLRGWIRSVTREEALAALTDAAVVASKIYTMDDIVDDETYRERGDVISVDDQDFGTVRMQGVIPKLSKHPGSVWRSGPSVGEDNDFVYKKLLGMADDELGRLHAD